MIRLKKISLLCLLLVLLLFSLSIYRGSHYKKNHISDKIDLYMNNYMNLKQKGDIKSENRKLEEGTEGGTITRYEDKTGDVLRYRLIHNGEMGEMEENYYFLDDAIYYTALEEIYDGPISNTPADSLYRTFKEVIMIDGKEWNYNGSDGRVVRGKKFDVKINSLEELNQLYEKARPEK